MHIEWGPRFQVHVKILDEQHQETIRLFNLLDDAAATKAQQEEVTAIIGKALNHLHFHCATEEHYFDEFRYGEAAEHKVAHRAFLASVGQVLKLYEWYPEKILENVMPLMRAWLEEHTALYDTRYTEFFHAHGLDGS